MHHRFGAPYGLTRSFSLAFVTAVSVLSLSVPGGGVAYAQQVSPRTSYTIPAGPLPQALNRLADTTGLQLIYDASATRALRTQGYRGDATATEGVTVLRPIILEATAPDQSGGLTTDGYVATASTIGTKTDTDLRKVPQSVSAVSRQELDDRNVQSMVDAVSYKSGVRTGVYGFDPRFDTIFLRGYNVSSSGYYRDGLRDLNGRLTVFRTEPYGLEGVTVLKGPSSALYGGGSPGGLVNAITKRPMETPFHEIEAQYGTWDRRQVNYDFSGPVAGNDNVLYRLTGIVRKADTQFIAAPNDRVYIAPALTFRSDDRDTHLTILGEYSDITTGGAAGWYSNNGTITDLQQGDPAYKDFNQKQWRIGYEFEHRFNENVTFRQNLRYSSIDADVKYVTFVPGLVFPDFGIGYRVSNRVLNTTKTFDVDNQFQLDFDTGPVQHTALLGLDYNHITSDYAYGVADLHTFDLTTRPYGKIPLDGVHDMNQADNRSRQNQLGLYAQDQIEYNSFVLTLGGRYDWISAESEDHFTPANSAPKHDDGAFTGRVGLSYLFENGFSPYVSYSTSFSQNVGLDAFGNPYEPAKGKQYEIGFKYAPTDLNLALNASLFSIEQTNMTVDYEGDPYKYVQLPGVKSRGFEIEATTSLARGLNLTASYTYLDMEISKGTDTVGNTPAGIPTNQFALWTTYEMQSGFAEGLMLGAGLRYYGKTWGDEANTIRNKERTLVDAAISYDFGRKNPKLDGLVGQINVKNVFDNRAVTCASNTCYREEGRNIVGSIRYRF